MPWMHLSTALAFIKFPLQSYSYQASGLEGALVRILQRNRTNGMCVYKEMYPEVSVQVVVGSWQVQKHLRG